MQTPSRELPILGGIAAFFRWIEELVNIASGPVLTIGLGISLVDLLTDGALLANLPILLYIWAVSQAVGVDAQLVAAFDRARTALRERRPWTLIGLLALGGLLAYVAWISAEVFALGQADHLTTTQALASIGMDHTVWLVQRSALSVGLVALSGWTRYHPPAKVRPTLEDELRELDRKTRLAEANQRLREVQAVGVAHLGRSLMAAAKGVQVQEEDRPENPPTGPGTPLVSAPNSSFDEELDEQRGVLTIPLADEEEQERLEPAARGSVPSGPRQIRQTITAEGRKSAAWRLLEANPDMSASELQRALRCRWDTADRLKKAFSREHRVPQRRVQ